MEAVAAAASIAGIITLAAQAIDGLHQLHTFFTEISTASKTISRLLSDINSLITTLTNIDDVLSHVELQRQNRNFALLDIKLEDCRRDVGLWLETAKTLRPGGEKGGRALVRRVRFAAKGEVVGRIREEIGRHRQALGLSLSVFGRTIDLHTSDQIYQMRGRFDDALTASLSSHGAHQDTLRRIEHYSITSLQSSAHSIRSMDSIRTELSRLEAMITSTRHASTSRNEQSEENLMVGSSVDQGQLEVIGGYHLHHPRPERPLSSVPGYLTEAYAQESRNGSSSASHYSSSGSSVLRVDNIGGGSGEGSGGGGREGNGGGGAKIDALTHPADFRYLVKEQEAISKRFSEISNANESALLYAQFSRDTSPMAKPRDGNSAALDDAAAIPRDRIDARLDHRERSEGSREVSRESGLMDERLRSQSARTSISQRVDDRSHGGAAEPKTSSPPFDHSSTYHLLEQSLAAAYPSIVANYLSLQNLTMVCQRHISLFEERPSIVADRQNKGGNGMASEPSDHLRLLRAKLEELQVAADASMGKCIEAGISRAECEEAVALICGSTPVQHPREAPMTTEARTQRLKDERVGKCDDQGDESDAYFSSME